MRYFRQLFFLTVLDRFVIAEVTASATLGFFTYTSLLLMKSIFGLVEQVFVRGIAVGDALQLLLNAIPQVMVLTLPMSFLFGVLIAMGRMNNDNEIIAIQGGGISVLRLLRPVVAVGFLLTLLCLYLTVEVMPQANRSLNELKVRLFASARTLGRVEPGVFNESFPNLLLYVQDVDEETGIWERVLLYDRTQAGIERLTLAQSGRVVSDRSKTGAQTALNPEERAGDGNPWLQLQDAVTHQFEPGDPETYRINTNQTEHYRLVSNGQTRTRLRGGWEERETTELIRLALNPESTDTGDSTTNELGYRGRHEVEIQKELHRRLSFPVACIAFSLVALPLGVGSRSGGRGRGFVLSLTVVLFYYVLLNNGTLLAPKLGIPVWIGVWSPNFTLAIVGLYLMRGMGRWLGEKHRGDGVTARLIRRWRRFRLDRRQARSVIGKRQELTGSLPIEIQRRKYAAGFPTLLDRYLLTRLFLPLIMVIASVGALYIVVDFSDHIEEIGENNVSAGIVLSYYWHQIPQIVLDVAPLALMIALLVLLTILERQQELTAFKAAGLSVFRVMVPVLGIALLSASGLWILQEKVVPEANRETTRLLDIIKGRDTARTYRMTDRQWLLSRDGTILYNFLLYDDAEMTLRRFTMYEIDPQRFRLRFHLFAGNARYENGAWMVDALQGWYRKILPDGTDSFKRIEQRMELDIAEGPGYFGQEYRHPSEMSFGELRAYINELQDSGYRPTRLIVRWHQKMTYPLSALLLVLLALPFGLNRSGGRATTMQGVAIALALGIGYFIILVAVLGKVGEADILPPALGAWSPVAIAFLLALNRMTTLRT